MNRDTVESQLRMGHAPDDGGNTANTVSEAELSDFIKNGAVREMKIVQMENGGYQIYIRLSWKDGIMNLVTTRKSPREWASLDRLVRHIRTRYSGTAPIINLMLSNVIQPPGRNPK